MYNLSIHFGPNAVVWAFLFKEKERAKSMLAVTESPSMVIEDDFGQWAMIIKADIHGIVLEDLDLTDEAKIIRSLANARNETKARQRAATDPVIRSGMQQGGNAVLTPFPRN